MNILVTGGTGYVGSSLIEELVRNYPNTKLTIIDDMKRGNNRLQLQQLDPSIEFIRTDLENLGHREFANRQFDIVVHCAANAYVGESEQNPSAYLTRNTVATLRLLEALCLESVKKFIFSSTCAVYGNASTTISEETSIKPESPYGWSKVICENIIQSYSEKYGFSTIIFRYFNVAGAVVDNMTGERHDPETHLIPLIFSASSDGVPFKVYGKDYETKDGTCEREYVHIQDLVRAHILAIESRSLNGFEVFNLCTGRPYSVLEVISKAEEAWNRKINYEYSGRRSGDAASLLGTCNKANNLLGWTPENSNLEKILTDYRAWKTKQN